MKHYIRLFWLPCFFLSIPVAAYIFVTFFWSNGHCAVKTLFTAFCASAGHSSFTEASIGINLAATLWERFEHWTKTYAKALQKDIKFHCDTLVGKTLAGKTPDIEHANRSIKDIQIKNRDDCAEVLYSNDLTDQFLWRSCRKMSILMIFLGLAVLYFGFEHWLTILLVAPMPIYLLASWFSGTCSLAKACSLNDEAYKSIEVVEEAGRYVTKVEGYAKDATLRYENMLKKCNDCDNVCRVHEISCPQCNSTEFTDLA